MKLETAILILREFAVLKVNAELVAHYEGDCIVKARALGIHLPDHPKRNLVEEIARRIYKNVDVTVGANVVMFA